MLYAAIGIPLALLVLAEVHRLRKISLGIRQTVLLHWKLETDTQTIQERVYSEGRRGTRR